MSELSRGDEIPRREWWWVVGLMGIISILFAWRVLRHWGNWGIQDWDFAGFMAAAPRTVLLDYGQFPLWNPWWCGGTPMLARPESAFLSPAFLLPLMVGAYIGIRLLILTYLLVGLLGAYRLGRHFGMGPVAGVLCALIYMCGGAYTSHLVSGNTWVLPMGLIPWAFLFFLRCLRKTFQVSAMLACAGVLALVWLGGAPYLLVMTVVWFGCYAGFGALCGEVRWRDAVRALGVVGVVTFGLCAVQLIPCLEFTFQYPRAQNPYAGFSVTSLGFGLLARDQTLHAVERLEDVVGFWRGISHGMNETGMYVGFVPLALCGVGVAAHGRRRLALVLCGVVCIWLSFGPRAAPLSLWNLLHDLPVFSIMRVPERFRLMFLLPLAIFAGLGLEVVERRLSVCGAKSAGGKRSPQAEPLQADGWLVCRGRARADRMVAGGLVVFVFADLLLVVAPLFNQTFTIRPLIIPSTTGGAFVQTASFYPLASGRWASEGDDTLMCAWSSHYPALLANQGIVEGNDEIPTPRMAVPVEDRRGYRGEVFLFQTEGTARYTRWSPNVLRIAVQAAGVGYVVVNQNFMPGWHVRGGGQHVEKVGGLLGLKVGPGEREVELFYRPWSVVLGAWVSVLTLAGVVGIGFWWSVVGSRPAIG